MKWLHRAILAASLLAGIPAAYGAAPPPVPALPDTERRTTYSITGTTCACAVNFAIYGDATDVDEWIQVWVNGVRKLSTDATFGWSLSSVTGPLATIPRPITDAVLTFNSVQTATVQIVGARRPRRTSQFLENRGVAARDINQVVTDLTAVEREFWDKINDFSGRTLLTQPGNTFAPLPLASTCANAFLSFGSNGLTPQCSQSITNFILNAGCGTTTFGAPISSTGTISAAEAYNPQTGTTYTVLTSDCGSLTSFSNAGAIAVTLPQASSLTGNFPAGWFEDLCDRGTGTATITPTVSTINGASTLVLATGQCARIISDGINYQVVAYSAGGGGGTVNSVSNSDGTLTISPTTGAVVASLALGHANTWTAVQTFTNSDIKLLGSSTGATTFTSANAGASNFTLTFPAVTDTLAVLATAQTWTAAQTFNANDLVLGGVTGSTQCLHANTSGVVTGTGSDCGSGGVTGSGANTQVAFWTSASALSSDSGFTYAGSGQATLALGTITTNLKALSITGTWNASGVTFDAPLFMNITNTASHAGSLVADIQVGSSTIFGFYNSTPSGISNQLTGNILGFANAAGNGIANLGTGTGFGTLSSGGWGYSDSNNWRLTFSPGSGAAQLTVSGSWSISWTSGADASAAGTYDTSLFRDAATSVLALGNKNASTTAAGFRVYNTTDNVGTGTAPTNYERGAFDWTTTANTLTIGTQKNGTGSARQVALTTTRHVSIGGGTPTANSCTGFALAAGSSDATGTVTYTSATTCSITFGSAYTNAPFCNITPGSAASTVEVVATTAGLTATFGTAQTAFTYQCFGA